MFQKAAQKHRIDTLELQVAELQTALADAIAALERAAKNAHLVGINRNGRSNTFIFARNGKVTEIETMGLLGDDPASWRRELLE